MTDKKRDQLKRAAAAARRKKHLHKLTHKALDELVPFITKLRENRFRDGSRYTGQREG